MMWPFRPAGPGIPHRTFFFGHLSRLSLGTLPLLPEAVDIPAPVLPVFPADLDHLLRTRPLRETVPHQIAGQPEEPTACARFRARSFRSQGLSMPSVWNTVPGIWRAPWCDQPGMQAGDEGERDRARDSAVPGSSPRR